MPIEKIAITDRDQWLAMREQDVTASIAGALLGVHPYSTAYGLYLQKSGRIHDDPEESVAMRRGRLLEPVAVQMLREDRSEWKIEEYPVGYYFRDPEARVGATPDVFATNEKGELGIVQIKSVEPSIFRRDWVQEGGLVEPPLWIVIQAVIEAKLTGRKWAAVAPMVIGFGVEMPIIPIPVHDGIFDRIKAEVASFWDRIASGQPYDPDYARDGSLIAKLYPRGNDAIEVDLSGDNEIPAAVDLLETARRIKKDAEQDEKTAKAVIAAKMGEASFARLADGRRLSNKNQDRDVKCKHVDGLFCSQSNYRVLRILKGH